MATLEQGGLLVDRGDARADLATAGKWSALLGSIAPVLAVLYILAVLVSAAFAPVISPKSPTQAAILESMMPPAWLAGGNEAHVLGTDLFGRDQLSRLIFGARISLSIAASAIVIGGVVGTYLGLISGYYGGLVDALVMRLVDVVLSFPRILLAIILAVLFGQSFLNVILIVSFLVWPRYARQIRAEVLSLRDQDFVTLARIAGASTPRICLKHLLPNVTPTLVVLVTLEVGHVILLESSLSFLGVGIPPPEPSWGVMVADGQGLLATGWWISLFPGIAIVLTVLAFNTLGDWLRDRFDPKLQRL